MHFAKIILFFMLYVLSGSVSAQTSIDVGEKLTQTNSSGEFKTAYSFCAKVFANKKIDPLRGKIPIWGDYTFAEIDKMQKNENRPTASEIKALRVFINASLACNKEKFEETYAQYNKADGKADSEANMRRRKTVEEETNNKFNRFLEATLMPLARGEITYADYMRRRSMLMAALAETANDSNTFQTYIESWLGPMREKFPADSPWQGFYNYAISVAKDVDSLKISKEEGNKLIEDRRLKINQEIASASSPKVTTLNCTLILNNGQRSDIPLTLDYTNSTVNGFKAQIQETDIYWSSGEYRNSLNRLSGFINITSEKLHNPLSGKCVHAEKKF
jgi:hypothetical protein